MPIRIRDIVAAGLILELRCRECRRIVRIPPVQLRKRSEEPLCSYVARLRCRRDGMLPDVWLVLERPEVDHEAMRRGLPIHRPPRTTGD